MSPTGKKLPFLDILLTLLVLLSVGLLGVQGQSTTLSASLCVFLLSKYPTEQSRPPGFSSWNIVIKGVLRVSVCSVARVSCLWLYVAAVGSRTQAQRFSI